MWEFKRIFVHDLFALHAANQLTAAREAPVQPRTSKLLRFLRLEAQVDSIVPQALLSRAIISTHLFVSPCTSL